MNRPKEEPLVVVVVIHFGSPENTSKCLEALYEVDYDRISIVLVDNSPDQRFRPGVMSQKLLLTYIASENNKGFCGGSNIGIQRALEFGADYIFLLNNDAIVDRNVVKEFIACMDRDARVAVATPKILDFNNPSLISMAGGELNINTGFVRFFGIGQKDGRAFADDRDVTFASGCAMFVRANLFLQIGLFDEALFCYAEDVDLSRRFIMSNWKIRYCAKAKVWHKHTGGRINGKMILPTANEVYYSTRNKVYNLRRYLSQNSLKEYAAYAVRLSRTFAAFALKYRRADLCLAILFGVFDCFARRMGPQSSHHFLLTKRR